jgi:blue light- and temperature-responsive anti-repressor
MTRDIYQILYCSRNCMHGTKPQTALEINDILSASRRNNVKVDVTGALLFNSILVAQVLEGPIDGVEMIFEQI